MENLKSLLIGAGCLAAILGFMYIIDKKSFALMMEKVKDTPDYSSDPRYKKMINEIEAILKNK